MLRKIKLYGNLAKRVGKRVLTAKVENAAQAVRFLVVNFPGIEKHMAENHYKVSADDWELDKDELHYPIGQSGVIKIMPVVGGAGGGTGKIIAGIALVAFSLAFPAVGAAIGGATMTKIGLVGGALILGGVAELMTPVPSIPTNEEDPRRSFSFSGIQNTSRAGVCVPVQYGTKVMVGSVVISAGIDTVQVEA